MATEYTLSNFVECDTHQEHVRLPDFVLSKNLLCLNGSSIHSLEQSINTYTVCM